MAMPKSNMYFIFNFLVNVMKYYKLTHRHTQTLMSNIKKKSFYYFFGMFALLYFINTSSI